VEATLKLSSVPKETSSGSLSTAVSAGRFKAFHGCSRVSTFWVASTQAGKEAEPDEPASGSTFAFCGMVSMVTESTMLGYYFQGG